VGKENSIDTIAIDDLAKQGASSRIFMALQTKPNQGLTTEEILEITGLSAGTIRSYGIPRLLNAQLVKREKTPEGKLFKLVRPKK
jgi:predicted transcriptional regulator